MPLTHRIDSLKQRHTDIETKLHAEKTRPSQDAHKISKLKREKLSLKDEIVRLTAQLEAA